MTFTLDLPIDNPYDDDDKLSVVVDTIKETIKLESRKYECELGFKEWETISGFVNLAKK